MKITPTLAGAMSGSLGGLTASHNRGGAYIRRRVVPTNPNSQRQADIRGYFGGLVQAWQAELTIAQRQTWSDYALATPTTDVLGQPLVLTGQQMFIRSNAVRLNLGFAFVGDAPVVNNTGGPVISISVFQSVAPNDVNITALRAANETDDGDVLFWVSRPLNISINFFKGPYQFMGSSPIAAGVTSVNNPDLTPEVDWVLTEEQYYSVRARIQYDDGRLSQPFDQIIQLAAAV